LQDTTTSVKIGVDVGVLNVGFDMALMRPLRQRGVAATAPVLVPKRGLRGMVL
jgi:hypothetical protein